MRTARLLPVSPSMHCAGGRCLLPREGGSVSASQGAVCFGGGLLPGGCLLPCFLGGRLLPREGGVSASQGAVCFGGGSASGGMSASLLPGGCLLPREGGVCLLPRGLSALGGGGSASGGCLLPCFLGGCQLAGEGCVSHHALRQTPPSPVNRMTDRQV